MQNESDFLIIGGGIAGLRAALTASQFGKVIVLTKGKIGETATEKAQGGIAAAIDEIKDSTQFHFEDTIEAGAGLCDEKAVRILVNEGVERVKELIGMGARFDRAETEGGGSYALALEGAHKRRRILHAGDATGAEIEKTLAAAVMKQKNISVYPQTLGIDLIMDGDRCIGAKALSLKENIVQYFYAKTVILTTGGMCQVYLYTTNPGIATGDGVAMAYRAGAEVTDMEFIQFHPTSLVSFKEFEDLVALPQFLISEAVRGEGGILLNINGERFMEKYHKQAELAPRDIVARAIFEEMKKTDSSYVNLQLSQIGAELIKKRFPIIYKTCLERGLDITKDNIPVAPAAHYAMGGIKTDTDGRTNICGLYAAGECTSLGVHGANRLASNSLLDGLVFGHRAAMAASKALTPNPSPIGRGKERSEGVRGKLTPTEIMRYKLVIKTAMWNGVGIVRSKESLEQAIDKLNKVESQLNFEPLGHEEIELKNMLAVSKLTAAAALKRTESRGAHFRTDYPDRDDINWKKHLVYTIIKT